MFSYSWASPSLFFFFSGIWFPLHLKWVCVPRPKIQTRPERAYLERSLCVFAMDPKGAIWEVGRTKKRPGTPWVFIFLAGHHQAPTMRGINWSAWGLWPLNAGVNGCHPFPSQSTGACSPCGMSVFLYRGLIFALGCVEYRVKLRVHRIRRQVIIS